VKPLPRGTTGRMIVRGVTGLTYWRRPKEQERDVVDGWTFVDDLINIAEDGNTEYPRAHRLHDLDGRLQGRAGGGRAGARDAPRRARVRGRGDTGSDASGDRDRVRRASAGIAPSEELKKQLQDHCKANLAPYKYPRRVEFIDALPRDPMGKVQPRRLKELVA